METSEKQPYFAVLCRFPSISVYVIALAVVTVVIFALIGKWKKWF